MALSKDQTASLDKNFVFPWTSGICFTLNSKTGTGIISLFLKIIVN
jgi:hypothetical protein